MTIQYLFVYGTLRRETATGMALLLARHGEYVADGQMQGKLYDVNGYPGAVASDNRHDTVYGELHDIGDGGVLLPLLDDYEECSGRHPEPHEYVRKKLAITLAGGGSVAAWVYVYNRDVSKLHRIVSGDYVHYVETSRVRKG
jgi:gamma-glutamylcyclotransferase (GGCT)/AIG2-like uncharacterized protein YtfP